MEANTLANPKADIQEKPPSQDDESEYESPWPSPGPSGKKEVPKLGDRDALLQSCASLV